MNKQELLKKITSKKEFSQLLKKDVEMAFKKFDSDEYIDEEKIKLTRALLMKAFSVFASRKLLNIKNKDINWFLKRHSSTRERFDFYSALYKKLLTGLKNNFTIFDLGAGINGLSYGFLPKNLSFNYIGIEAMGQLVDLMNYNFNKEGVKNCKAFHLSLFEIEKIKKYIKQIKGKKIVFLFKTLDSLEMLEKNYSKKLLNEIVLLVDKVVVSFATKSLISRREFKANRKWLIDFIKDNFEILEEFEFGSEKYIVFRKIFKNINN